MKISFWAAKISNPTSLTWLKAGHVCLEKSVFLLGKTQELGGVFQDKVEETFFVLQGYLDAFIEDEEGNRLTTHLGKWDCITCPPGVIHGYDNNSLEPVWFQVMLGRGKPETMGYADDDLYERRDDHLKSS